MQISASNETHAFCAIDDHVERSVLRSIKTKTVRIKSLLFLVRKFLSRIPVTCKALRIYQIHLRLIFILARHTHCCQF